MLRSRHKSIHSGIYSGIQKAYSTKGIVKLVVEL